MKHINTKIDKFLKENVNINKEPKITLTKNDDDSYKVNY